MFAAVSITLCETDFVFDPMPAIAQIASPAPGAILGPALTFGCLAAKTIAEEIEEDAVTDPHGQQSRQSPDQTRQEAQA